MTIMVAIDMHVKTLVCEIGFNLKTPKKKTYPNTFAGHEELLSDISQLKGRTNASNVLVGYEASGLGYLLYDRVLEAGYQCAVMAPTEMLRSPKGYKKKTDKKDASYIYQIIRGHVLAGNRLYDVWVPDKELREHRDFVRTLHDISNKVTKVKCQVQTLLKKYGLTRPEGVESWTIAFKEWLCLVKQQQGIYFQSSLDCLLRQLEYLEGERKLIEKEVALLGETDRYRKQYRALTAIMGVGVKTAMTFLTELGDMKRFSNRKKLGAYLGLVPATFESGDADDRKGRITRDGPFRVRSVLNQAIWSHLNYNGEEKAVYDKLCARNPKHKKKAVVACMRRLAIRMWHIASDVIDDKIAA